MNFLVLNFGGFSSFTSFGIGPISCSGGGSRNTGHDILVISLFTVVLWNTLLYFALLKIYQEINWKSEISIKKETLDMQGNQIIVCWKKKCQILVIVVKLTLESSCTYAEIAQIMYGHGYLDSYPTYTVQKSEIFSSF